MFKSFGSTLLHTLGSILNIAGAVGPALAQSPDMPPNVQAAGMLAAEIHAAEQTLLNLAPGEALELPGVHLDIDGHGPNKGGTVVVKYIAD